MSTVVVDGVPRVFDWLSHHDERSRNYPAMALCVGKVPKSRTWGCKVYLDQGQEGSCHDAKTEILTTQGWIPFPELTLEHKLATVDPATRKLIFEYPTRVVTRPYRGLMVRGESASVDFLVTPEHKMLVRKWDEGDRTLSEEYEFVEAEKLGWYAGLMGSIRYEGDDNRSTYTLPGVPNRTEGEQRLEKDVPLDTWLMFLGIYLAEGTLLKVYPDNYEYKIQLAASKEREKSFIRYVLDGIGQHFVESNDRFVISNRRLYTALEDLGLLGVKAPAKFVPEFVFRLGADHLKHLLLGHFMGDGCEQYEGGVRAHYTASSRLADDLQRLMFLSGYLTGFGERAPRTSVMKDGRIVAGKHPEFCVRQRIRDRLSIERTDHISREFYDGLVYCAEVPTYHTLVTRRNRRILISGNCTGHAVAHEGAAQPIVIPGVTHEIAVELYRRAKQLDEWPGEGYEGSSVNAAMKAATERGWYVEWRWAFGADDLATAVPALGPAVLGIPWYEGMGKPDGLGWVHPTGKKVGGHAILCVGYNLKKDAFRLHNSWGVTWGFKGDCWISRTELAQLLKDGGEAAIPLKRLLPTKAARKTRKTKRVRK